MERIYTAYKNDLISIDDAYEKYMSELGLNEDDALIAACLTLITAHPSKKMLRRYSKPEQVLYREREYVYNALYEESPVLSSKYTDKFGEQMLLHPVLFYARYMFED